MVLQNILKKGCSRRVDFKNNIYNGLAILAMQMAILFQGQFVNGKNQVWQFFEKEN
jgi:hypothetical protein